MKLYAAPTPRTKRIMKRSGQNRRIKLVIEAVALITATLVICELILFILERKFSIDKFGDYREAVYENFYYYYLKSGPSSETPSWYNRLLGWRDFTETRYGEDYILSPIYSHRWRHTYRVKPQKDRVRVVLIGGSFTYGWDVGPNEAIDYFLSGYLGRGYEVINLGVRGYGFDQMALLAIESVRKYHPDIVVINFIGDDLRRDLVSFNSTGSLKKPYFALKNGMLILQGVPVPTPYEVYRYHQRPAYKLKDALLTWSRRSRIICLIAQLFLKPAHDKLANVVSPMIATYIQDQIGCETRVLFFHLDGKLPRGFEKELYKRHINFSSIPPFIDEIGKRLNCRPEWHLHRHPKSGLNRIYAYFISQKIMSTKGVVAK